MLQASRQQQDGRVTINQQLAYSATENARINGSQQANKALELLYVSCVLIDAISIIQIRNLC